MTETNKLDAERHEAIYTKKIADYYLPKSKPQAHPCAVITGGQPGSGKSGIMGVVAIIGQITGLPLGSGLLSVVAFLAVLGAIVWLLAKVGEASSENEQPLTPEEQQARAIQAELAASRRAMESLRRWTIWRTIIGR